ncbi:hypothetical protein AAH978_03100 [Streptomyces sp. ZYX-F-203]
MDIDIRRASPAGHLALGEITTQAYPVDGHLDNDWASTAPRGGTGTRSRSATVCA